MSRKSGLIYEQRLINKYINDNGKDPVTGDALELDDLIEIKSSKFSINHNSSGRRRSRDAGVEAKSSALMCSATT